MRDLDCGKGLIVNDWPPNIAAIRAVLPVTRNNIFAYGGTIYSPGSSSLPPELIAHEQVHFEQQAVIGVDQWWTRFLADPKFRLSQEIPAHKAEYRHMLRAATSRQQRRFVKSKGLKMLGKRLSAPMYGGIITTQTAMQEIAG
jgi:hypothetical protein